MNLFDDALGQACLAVLTHFAKILSSNFCFMRKTEFWRIWSNNNQYITYDGNIGSRFPGRYSKKRHMSKTGVVKLRHCYHMVLIETI